MENSTTSIGLYDLLHSLHQYFIQNNMSSLELVLNFTDKQSMLYVNNAEYFDAGDWYPYNEDIALEIFNKAFRQAIPTEDITKTQQRTMQKIHSTTYLTMNSEMDEADKINLGFQDGLYGFYHYVNDIDSTGKKYVSIFLTY